MTQKLTTVTQLSLKDFDFLAYNDNDGNLHLTMSQENIYRLLVQFPFTRGKIRYNVFSSKIQVYFDWRKNSKKWTDVHDRDYLDLCGIISNCFPQVPMFAKVTKNIVADMVARIAWENSYNPVKKYLENVEWDGVERVNTWLDKVYGCGDSELYRRIGRNWIVQYMRRVTAEEDEKTKADYVLVLEGLTGLRKSQALVELAVIGNEEEHNGQHVEMTSLPSDKAFPEKLMGASIVEFAEGSLVSRADVQTLKQQITNLSDTFRPSYGREVQTFIRRCVFAMNTNEGEYLRDMTGARRWHPVPVEKKADVEWLVANKEQLFAEAYQIHKSGEKTWELVDSYEQLEMEQELRRVRRVEEDSVISWYYSQSKARLEDGVTIMEIFNESVKTDLNRLSLDNSTNIIIGSILLGLFRMKKQQKSDGKRYYIATPLTFSKWGTPKGKSVVLASDFYEKLTGKQSDDF